MREPIGVLVCQRLSGGQKVARQRRKLEVLLVKPTADPSRPWPEDRKVVELGAFTLNTAVQDSTEAQKKLLFLPGQVPDGIELSDNSMITVRTGAYAESFSRRNR